MSKKKNGGVALGNSSYCDKNEKLKMKTTDENNQIQKKTIYQIVVLSEKW